VSVLYSGSTLKINLKAIADNYFILKAKAGGREIAAVVKANAYGLGVEKVAPVLKEAGCKLFFVANLDEALELREILPSSDIAVLNGVIKGQGKFFAENNIIPVLNSMEQIDLWSKTFNQKPSMIHVDSGMNRLGIPIDEYEKVINSGKLEKLNVKLILSHLACADEKKNTKNVEQLNIVRKVAELTPNFKISFANSSGIFLGKDYHFDIVRPGIALYGGNPIPNSLNPMKNVVEITANILQIRNIDSEETVGYGATYILDKGSKIATLPIGYADGYFRVFGNRSYCAINGKKVPVVGRVSMDLITIDITSIKDEINIGDEVEILGANVKLDELVELAETIDYEVLTSLGSRYRRIYTN